MREHDDAMEGSMCDTMGVSRHTLLASHTSQASVSDQASQASDDRDHDRDQEK